MDKHIESLINKFNTGKKREMSKKHKYLNSRVGNAKVSVCRYDNNQEKRKYWVCELRKRKKELKEWDRQNGLYDPMDPNFRRISYVRYADDILLGIIATQSEAKEIYENIQNFIKKELLLQLNEQKTHIMHNTEKIKFLGYEIDIMHNETNTVVNGKVGLWLPYEVMRNFIIDNGFGKFVCDAQTGKPKLKAIHRSEMINIDDYEILLQYNSKIRGLYNYYKLAINVCKMNGFIHIAMMSFFRTLASKHKTTCSKLFKNNKYSRRKSGKTIVGIDRNDKFHEFFDGPFVTTKHIDLDNKVDTIENTHKYFSRTSLNQRLEAKKCEFCGSENGPFEVHHVRKLKDLKGKPAWEKLMIARRRKTMVLCTNCHHKLHSGKL